MKHFFNQFIPLYQDFVLWITATSSASTSPRASLKDEETWNPRGSPVYATEIRWDLHLNVWTCLVAIDILFIQIIVTSNMECAKFWNSLLLWLAWIVHQILSHCFLRPGIHLLPVLAVSNSVTGMTSTCHREYSHIICISTIHHLLSSSILRLLTLHHNTSPIIVSYHSHMSCHVIPHPMSKSINTSNI